MGQRAMAVVVAVFRLGAPYGKPACAGGPVARCCIGEVQGNFNETD